MSRGTRLPPAGAGRLALLAAILVSAAAYAFVLSVGLSTLEPFDDYTVHNRLAGEMAERRRLAVPHPLYHLLAIAADAILPGGIEAGGFATALLAQVALAALLFEWLRRAAGDTGTGRGTARAALLTAAVMVASPVNVFTPGPGAAYFGYFPPNTLHSPTTVLVRPLSLALFAAVAAAGALQGVRRAATLAALALLCGLAKPSYLSCLAPALALAWLLGGGQREARTRTMLAVCLPAAGLLAFQVWFTLEAQALPPSSIVVRPFEYLSAHTSVRPSLVAFKLAMSVAFPIVLACAYAPQALRDGPLRLAWIAFATGVLQAYLLAETGARAWHGNFTWGAQVGAFVLFAASARWWLGQRGGAGRSGSFARSACALALAAHAAVGLAELRTFARSGPPFAPAQHDPGTRP